jgi:hypothetical protein
LIFDDDRDFNLAGAELGRGVTGFEVPLVPSEVGKDPDLGLPLTPGFEVVRCFAPSAAAPFLVGGEAGVFGDAGALMEFCPTLTLAILRVVCSEDCCFGWFVFFSCLARKLLACEGGAILLRFARILSTTPCNLSSC